MRARTLRWGFVVATMVVGGCGGSKSSSTSTAVSTAASTAAASATSTAASTATSTGASTTTSSSAPVSGQPGVWPTASESAPFDDPALAAKAFAVGFVGFTDPVVGPFTQGDSRSGEVEVRPKADGPVTTVFVRQLNADTTWSVIGAGTADINLTQPAAFNEVSTPLHLVGTSTAFEGTVQVSIRDRSGGAPLATGFVTGGSMGTMGPFESTLAFTRPATKDGAVILYTVSMADGRVSAASVVGLRFTGVA